LNDCNIIALIALSLFISAALCSVSDSYSQLYNPHGVKILSPTKDQEVPINIQNFTVEGVSTDNSTNNCDVSLLLNGITPYVKVSSKGQNGPDDFSVWERIFNSLQLNVGENKLTAKLFCSGGESNQITKYHSVNFTGTNETTSTPITKELNSPSIEDNISPSNTTEIVETEPTSSETETTSTPITKELNSPSIEDNISPSNTTEIVESEPTSSEFEDQTFFMSRDQIARNITSGPVIIPPSASQDSSMLESSPVNDSVIIPNATSSVSSSDNSTSAPVLIPPRENASSAGHPVPVSNQSYDYSNQVSKEIIEQPDPKGEENDDIPLILPTPSPRVTSDNDRVNSIANAPVRDLSPEIVVENNDTGVSSSSSKSDTSSSVINHTVSEPNSGGPLSNVKIPDSSVANLTESIRALNASAIQVKNQSGTTLGSNSSERGENASSIRALAGVDQIVNEGMEVILSGDSTSTNSSQLSYEWRQVGGDVNASLGPQNVKQISFQAPAVDIDSKLTFRFIVSANGTQISSDEVGVTINDIPQNLEENESSDSQDGEMSESDDNEDDDDT
jgi:K319-like protein